jgi:hypothetical protein
MYEVSSLQDLRFSQWLAEDSSLLGCDIFWQGRKSHRCEGSLKMSGTTWPVVYSHI